ncbi:hypothetical protein GGQ92_001606 [Gracilibacillus halotolerans]|uniref:Alpha-L-rhamnosidase n=1 Tax=Gracilibacillus halotolerans TaxID=74386 RepID=A0A841RLQ7_9BACI|nr:sugar hydrolase [Gracilibacillus halotolerans]MBB6512817.1 hypothetical protein [Gracilibacillus halotolerans]
MEFQQNLDHEIVRNERFEKVADQLKPTLHRENVEVARLVEVEKDEGKIHGWGVREIDSGAALEDKVLGKGDSIILDFNDHLVGYLKLDVKPVGSPPDAPLHLKLTFGEMPVEVAEPFSNYKGRLSSSWLQEEIIHVDVLPQVLEFSRRYSFRYLKLEVLDTSPKYKVSFTKAVVETVTSADKEKLVPAEYKDNELAEIERISNKTLLDCMQDVFEDGPKRDRRLWLGDLHLQAQANYVSFQNNDLVKRNLYQFAAVPNQHGQVSANLFIAPTLIPDDTFLYDYSLLFTSTLHDYYEATGDKETLVDLWPTALRQVELGIERLDENNIVIDDETWWSFIDWQGDLNKQAPSQAILLFVLRKAIALAEALEKKAEQEKLAEALERITQATVEHLWDEEQGFFISGSDRQVSWASQVWMVLAGVLEKEDNQQLLKRLLKDKEAVGMNTPYMHHHLVEALFISDLKKEALDWIKMYWGGMVRDGADTFWELYNPEDKEFSPYGDHIINSYCHAWSCTPTYLLRKYL